MARNRRKNGFGGGSKTSSTLLTLFAAASTVTKSGNMVVEARVPDRGRVVATRKEQSNTETVPIQGPRYRGRHRVNAERDVQRRAQGDSQQSEVRDFSQHRDKQQHREAVNSDVDEHDRELSSQLTGCCSNYQYYYAEDLCALYGFNCESGGAKSHDSGDGDCTTDGLSFIGVSFSVNTAHGNPYSYQLCDQLPMENIIDRDYDYVMSMDEDGWLVGGGYKTFDYSGKMPYIDSSHTELLRVGNMDPTYGGTTIEQVYAAMESVSLPPISIYPEYVKGGGGHNSGDDDGEGGGQVPAGDVTLAVSVVDVYTDDADYSEYDLFLEDLFSAMEAVGGGPCMDDDDTDPHVSMSRGVKFFSSTHQYNYFYAANLEVAVWQVMYPNGVVIGSSGYAAFPPNSRKTPEYIGYGNLYFFYDRANITAAFNPNYRSLTSTEQYYAELFTSSSSDELDAFYSSVPYIDYEMKQSGSGDGGGNDEYWEHNAYNWKATMAIHDMTEGWDLPPNCEQEGETFFGIPLSRKSSSSLQSTPTFQEQFDWTYILDYNYTYVTDFGTNHGWLIGEQLDNAVGSIVDKDTAHIPIFYTGTTNPNKGGMSLSQMIKVAKNIDFGSLYIKPAFCFVDDYGHLKLQFEADSSSALGYLYDAFCETLGISWNYDSPYNSYGYYTSCAMHSSGDRAQYGCGPDNSNSGGFCPQMYIAYGVKFKGDDYSAAYLNQCNNYVDYWRSLYPTGVAAGTSNFCPDGGCMALFLNRMDVYEVFKPDLGGSWVEFNGASAAPTVSMAPTVKGGCDEPANFHLDRCFRVHNKRKASPWKSLGPIGQMCIVLITFMASTLAVSIFLARARRRKRKGEGYLGFFLRDLQRSKKKKRKKRRKRDNGDLAEDMLGDDYNNDDDDQYGGSRSAANRKSRNSSRSRSSSRRRSRSSRAGGSRSSSRRTSRTNVNKESGGDDRDHRSRRSRSRSDSRGGSPRRRSRSRRRTDEEGGGSRSPSRTTGRSVTSKRRQLV